MLHGETMATALLQLDPQKRLGAEDAMTHRYFEGLPKKLLELPDGEFHHFYFSYIVINTIEFFFCLFI